MLEQVLKNPTQVESVCNVAKLFCVPLGNFECLQPNDASGNYLDKYEMYPMQKNVLYSSNINLPVEESSIMDTGVIFCSVLILFQPCLRVLCMVLLDLKNIIAKVIQNT